jgi:rhodanese-related sulfurtransferase
MTIVTEHEERTIADLLDAVRSGLPPRPDPLAARDAPEHGALLVDIRPVAQRHREGDFADAVVIERNVLEWRLDPRSPDRLPIISDHEVTIIVACSEGYASSLAAESLQRLGLHNATDLDGGFVAWKAAGLPVAGADPQP